MDYSVAVAASAGNALRATIQARAATAIARAMMISSTVTIPAVLDRMTARPSTRACSRMAAGKNQSHFPPFRTAAQTRMDRPKCKVSAEKKRVSLAVRQEKGNLLEGKERVTGP